MTDLLSRLTALGWIQIVAPSAGQLATLATNESFRRLGTGEQEAIALALEHPPSVLLGNDNQARRLATQLGVDVVNIPAFLLACKQAHLLNRESLAALIADLRDKDFFGFRQSDLNLLMG